MKNQALQYDSGKYYYIEDYPKKPDFSKGLDGKMPINFDETVDWAKAAAKATATRIEVAPDNIYYAEKLMPRKAFVNGPFGTYVEEGIYPVQVKVEMVKRGVYTHPKYSFGEAKAKQYAILSEPERVFTQPSHFKDGNKDLSVTVSEEFEPKSDLPDADLILNQLLGLSIEAKDLTPMDKGEYKLAMKEYGKQLLASLRKEIESKITETNSRIGRDVSLAYAEAKTNGLQDALNLIDTITPQEQ